jgi:hypothetical protein
MSQIGILFEKSILYNLETYFKKVDDSKCSNKDLKDTLAYFNNSLWIKTHHPPYTMQICLAGMALIFALEKVLHNGFTAARSAAR